MVLPHETVLPTVAERVGFVAPFPVEEEPACGGGRIEGGGGECVGWRVVGVGTEVEGWVPEGASRCGVVEHAQGENVRL